MRSVRCNILFFISLTVLFSTMSPLPANSQTVQPHAVIRVGVYNNPPKIFVDDEGRADGILWHLLASMATQENWELQAIACEWNDCLMQLESGGVDLMPDVAVSDSRSERFDFHLQPALFSWSQIYERDGTELLSLLDMAGRRIALLQGSVQLEYLSDLAMNFGIQVDWVLSASMEDAFQSVVNGSADAVVSNHYFGDLRAAELGLVKTPIIFQPVQLYYAIADPRLQPVLDAIDRNILLWKTDPQSPYFSAINQWSVEQTSRTLPVWVLWGVAVLAAALLMALAFGMLLRARVADKTRSLLASESRLNTILNSVDAYIYIKDTHLRYQYANRKVCELFGSSPEHITGKTDADFFDEATCKKLLENDSKVLHSGERVANEEMNILQADQQERYFISVKLPLRNPDNSIYALCGISTDITEHRQIRNQLHQLAYFDVLTDLPNRRLVMDRLQHALASRLKTGYEGAVLFIDLDNFKTINDTLGHERGDLLLQQVARRLERGLLSTDTAGRLGEDEFVLIVEDVARDANDASARISEMADFLRQQFAQPFDLDGAECVCSVSIGVAMFSDAGGDVDTLLKGADLALSAAKNSGRNVVRFFNPDMQIEVTRRTRIELALRKAIELDSVRLFLQPQVDRNGDIVSLEALLRLTDQVLGDIPPADFIPVAERSGLIVPLGEWVVDQACQLLQRWRTQAALQNLTLAVNVSPRQFHHGGFTNHIYRCLKKYNLPGSALVLEVTESLLIDDIDTTVLKMQAIGAKGVQFALDDFGTGYASLSYLKRLPLTQLKIDRSFVRDLLVDQNDEAIVRTIIALGNSLDMQVVAEGVETRAQADRLQEMGCHHFQGYHFGRPQPIEDYEYLPGSGQR